MSDETPPSPAPSRDDHATSAPAVVPRWEWRTFGPIGDGTRDRLASLTRDAARDSDELYLVSTDGQDAVKVRAGLMDVKRLEELDGFGLERWRPVMKVPFPLPAGDVPAVWEALRLPVPRLARTSYTVDELLQDLVEPSVGVRAVAVRKRRRRFTLDGCSAELSEVTADGRTVTTLAVESEHADRVAAAVQGLGLAAIPNVSYPRWLREITGLAGPRYAVIDIGTNSVKFHLAERDTTGRWRTIDDRAEVTRLGQGLAESGRLGPEPARRTEDAVVSMAEQARRAGAVDIVAVGTAGLRMATNPELLIDAVRARCGVGVEVITGEEESRLGYLAATSTLAPVDGSVLVFETGGGSSQFTFGHPGGIDEQFSLDVGAARFAERFGLDGVVSTERLDSALAAIEADLGRLEGRPTPGTIIGIGGALTNLAAVRHGLATYAPEIVHGTILDLAEIDRQIALYRTRDADERRTIVGLQPKRAEVILAGACIVRTVIATLGCDALTVSDRGLRHALLVERFGADRGVR